MQPADLGFQGEGPDEEIRFILHRHAWTLLHTGLGVVVCLLLLTATFLINGKYLATSWEPTSIATFILIPIALYLGARAWFIWSNTLYILTNERIIAVEQHGWFSRHITELSLDNIMALDHEVKGIAATSLNFGNVNIQASGASDKDVTLANVYDPYEVQQRIFRAKRGDKAAEEKS